MPLGRLIQLFRHTEDVLHLLSMNFPMKPTVEMMKREDSRQKNPSRDFGNGHGRTSFMLCYTKIQIALLKPDPQLFKKNTKKRNLKRKRNCWFLLPPVTCKMGQEVTIIAAVWCLFTPGYNFGFYKKEKKNLFCTRFLCLTIRKIIQA